MGPKSSDGPFSDANITPASPAIVEHMTSARVLCRSIRTPDRRAASGLPPIAYRYRPAGVCAITHQK